MSVLQQVLAKIDAAPCSSETKLVAIDGRGGSGKSKLASELQKIRTSIEVLELDAFPYLDKEYPFHHTGTQTRINTNRIIGEALIPLQRGQQASFERTFWWKDAKPSPIIQVKPGGIVLAEGCYALLPELRSYWDFSIWIECPPQVAMERAIARDGEDIRLQWEQAYFKNEERYVEIHQPADHADLVVYNTGDRSFELI